MLRATSCAAKPNWLAPGRISAPPKPNAVIDMPALASLIGVQNSNLALTDKLAFAPVHYSLPQLQQLAVNNRPDIRSARLARDSLAQSVRSARAQPLPDVFVEGRRASLNPATPGTSLRVGVTFPLFNLGRDKADVSAAQAALAEQDANFLTLSASRASGVETAFRNLAQARSTVKSFQSGRLEHAKQLLDMSQTGYEKGATGIWNCWMPSTFI